MHEDYFPFIGGALCCLCAALVLWKQLPVVAGVLVTVGVLGVVAAFSNGADLPLPFKAQLVIFFGSPFVLLGMGLGVLGSPKISTKGKIAGGLFTLIAAAVSAYAAIWIYIQINQP